MNKIFKFLPLTIALVISTLTFGQPVSKSLLWKISGNDLTEPSYLFGTYHLLGDGFLTEVPEIETPFKNAKGVVVEMVIDSSKLLNISMMAVMRDKKISTLLSPEDFKLVSDTLEKISGFSLKMMDMFKPSQVSAALVLLQSQKLNEKTLSKYPGIPLDVHFASAAKKNAIMLTPLETMEAQMKLLLDQFPVEEQARQLVDYVKNSNTFSKTHVDMLNLYLQKDLDALSKLMESIPEDLMGNSDYLLKDRNEKWMKTLPPLMRSGSQFIAVGAGHLPGEDGMLSLLQKAGYQVTPVSK